MKRKRKRKRTRSERKGKLTLKLVASEPNPEGLMPREVVATIRVSPRAISRDESPKAAFVGLMIDGAEALFSKLVEKGWIDAQDA